MCDGPDEKVTRFERKRVPGKCIKCKRAQPNVTIRGCLYCKPCFVRASVAKFRTALSKSRKSHPMPVTARAMVAVSGGPASSAMAQLALDYHRSVAMKGGTAQPLYADVVIGHVDESALFEQLSGGAGALRVRDVVPEGAAEWFEARLEDVFAESDGVLLRVAKSGLGEASDGGRVFAQLAKPADSAPEPPRERLRRLFDGLASATDREAMLDAVKTELLVRLAQRANCQVLLLGDSATRLATKVVSLTCRGRGLSLPLETAAESTWFDGVVVMRPMRDFTAKEVGFFNRWTRQPVVCVPTFTTGLPFRASIGRLAESFVAGLDGEFSSTVATVCRTVHKLEPSPEALQAPHCVVCAMPAEPSNAQARVPNGATQLTVPSPEQTGTSGKTSLSDQIEVQLCYSCRNTLGFAAAVPGDLMLPSFCIDRLKNHPVTAGPEGREVLRKQIAEFLIDDCEA
ncbi:Cytoplasmic tRNA 2-thiolation protein 2 [Coemansia sp. Benny D115]|nr:Cytoplasmic tRNA 2-thiolation protein 2 [Coemansia sp. Benny D115]